MRCINWYEDLKVGFVGGEIPRVPTNLILLKAAKSSAYSMGRFLLDIHESERNFQEILDYV